MKDYIVFLVFIVIISIFMFVDFKTLINKVIRPAINALPFSSRVKNVLNFGIDVVEQTVNIANTIIDVSINAIKGVKNRTSQIAGKIGRLIPLLDPIPDADPEQEQKYIDRGLLAIGIALVLWGGAGLVLGPAAAIPSILTVDTYAVAAGSLIGGSKLIRVLPSITVNNNTLPLPSSNNTTRIDKPPLNFGPDDEKIGLSTFFKNYVTLGYKHMVYFYYDSFLFSNPKILSLDVIFSTEPTFKLTRLINTSNSILEFEYRTFKNFKSINHIITDQNDQRALVTFSQKINPGETYEFLYSTDTSVDLYAWRWYKI